MITTEVDSVWNSIQESNSYRVVIDGDTFVRLKAVDNEDLVATITKEKLYEWFQKDLEAQTAKQEDS